MKITRKLFYLLNNFNKQNVYLLIVLLIIAMIIEMIGTALLLPILNSIQSSHIEVSTNISYFFHQYFLINDSKTILYFLLFFLVGFFLFKAFYTIYISNLQLKFISDFSCNLSQRLYYFYLNEPYKFHLKTNSAELYRNVRDETDSIAIMFQSGLLILTEMTSILALAILLFIIEPVGSIILLFILFIPTVFFLRAYKNKLSFWGSEKQYYNGKRSQMILEGFGGIKDVKLLNRSKFFSSKFSDNNSSYFLYNRLYNVMTVIPRIYLEFLSVFALVILIFSMLLKQGVNTEFVPTLGIFVASAFRMIPSVNRVVNSMQTIKFYTSSLDIVYELFNKVKGKKIEFNSDNKKLNGSLLIENMSYSYDDSSLNILDDININIKKGDFVGIIGESGSGKSTLINIISGLLLPTKGNIYVENIKLNNENIVYWMQSIGYVPQHIFLTDDTIKNNIAFGVEEKNIDIEKLIKALKDSRLYDFVYSLSDNFNTNVGENGVKLSGGQRQRIGIARALYNNPEVLILDEATSALDTETEIKIMKEIVTLKGSRTLLIVAHRLSTLESCDYIIEIKNGKISRK